GKRAGWEGEWAGDLQPADPQGVRLDRDRRGPRRGPGGIGVLADLNPVIARSAATKQSPWVADTNGDCFVAQLLAMTFCRSSTDFLTPSSGGSIWSSCSIDRTS